MRPDRLTDLARWFGLALVFLTAGSLAGAADQPAPDIATINQRLGRGINLGNMLEAPSEGEWGLTLKAEYFDAIARAGFNSVRLPVRWGTHAQGGPDFTIDPKYFARVDWAIDQAVQHKLAIVLNIHHDEAAAQDSAESVARAASFWKQIAPRYKDQSDRLVFELLNEPHDPMTDEKWQAQMPTLLAAIRASNPTRAVIVGPGHWNNLGSLDKLTLPESDRHLIVTFHYYSPFEFTHQGAEWTEGTKAWLGRTWTDTAEQRDTLRRDLARAAAWGKAHNRPVYLGEFGAYNKADMDSRVTWTRAVAREAESLQISWCYWEFAAGFGAYDPQTNEWRKPILNALIPGVVRLDNPRRQNVRDLQP